MQVFATYELYRYGSDSDASDQDGQHDKIAQCLSQRIEKSAQRRGGNNLSHTRPLVSLNSVLHQVKAGQGEQRRGQECNRAASPGGIVYPAHISQSQCQVAGTARGKVGIRGKSGQAHNDQKTVAPDALAKISAY